MSDDMMIRDMLILLVGIMQRLSRLRQKVTISGLRPARKLRCYKIMLISSVSLMMILNLISLAVVGSNFMVWTQLETPQSLDFIDERSPGFFITQQLIIAFDAIFIGIVLLLCFSVFKFYTKGNLIIIGVTVLFFAARWVCSVVYLASGSEFTDILDKKYSMLYTEGGQLNALCDSESCTSGQALNYVQCGKVLLWKQSQGFQIAFTIMSVFVVGVLVYSAYWANYLDVVGPVGDQGERELPKHMSEDKENREEEMKNVGSLEKE